MTILDDMTKKTMDATEKYPMSKIFFGVLFVILGIAGVIIPVLPGWPFFVIGFELLGIKFLYFDKALFYLVEREKDR